jgi:hypothetical protein
MHRNQLEPDRPAETLTLDGSRNGRRAFDALDAHPEAVHDDVRQDDRKTQIKPSNRVFEHYSLFGSNRLVAPLPATAKPKQLRQCLDDLGKLVGGCLHDCCE